MEGYTILIDILFVKTIIFVLFIFLSAFFSAAETAFTAINRIKLRSIIEAQKKQAHHIEFLLQHPKKLLTAILIGNNLANIAATTFATAFFIDLLRSIGFTNIAAMLGIITVLVTFILLVFGEITPKTLAMKNPSKWAFNISSIIYYIYFIEYPFIWLFYSITKLLSSIFGIQTTASAQLSEEEIKLLIQLGQEEGILEKEEQKMLHGVINVFDKVVREIMTPRTDMICLERSSSIAEAIDIIRSKGHSRIPIYEEKIDNIIGFVYAKDLLYANHSNQANLLHNFMREAVFIPETKQIQSLLQQMRKKKFHLSIVVDEHGGVAGLVTMEDIIEEIVGEIQDEYDNEKLSIKKLTSSRYIIDAAVRIEELSETLGYQFPEDEDYDTVAGFILAQIGSFPKKNDKISYEHFDFIVRDIKNRRIIAFDVVIHKEKSSS
ncbi:MAG: hemolysin [Rickettsiales bacterium]|nr:hemolysin [Rickettsiales bacterium]